MDDIERNHAGLKLESKSSFINSPPERESRVGNMSEGCETGVTGVKHAQKSEHEKRKTTHCNKREKQKKIIQAGKGII